MAVTETPPTIHPPGSASGARSSGGSWFKKNKAVAIAGAAAAGFLLLSHKGSGTAGSQDASTVASDAAAEQAAIDQAVGANNAANGLAAGSAASGGGGDSGTGTSDTGTNDTVGSASGPGPTTTPGEVINIGAPAITINSAGAGLATGQPSATITAPAVKEGNATPAQNAAINSSAAKSAAAARAAVAIEQKQGAKPGPAPKGGTTGASLFISGQAPAPPKAPPKTKPKTKTKGSVMKFGRAFPDAVGVHVGQCQVTSDGVRHEPVTVNYGGYSETHMCHNRGQAWTDNVPGYSPPSRGVPLERLGTV